MAFHYRGYRPSEGTPSEAALFQDAVLIHDRLVARLQPRRVILAGFSLGSGVAAYLASKRAVAGTSPGHPLQFPGGARGATISLGSGDAALLRHPFRSDRYLAGLAVPAAVIMASEDGSCRPSVARRWCVPCVDPCMVETISGSHNGIYGGSAIDAALRRALDALLAAS